LEGKLANATTLFLLTLFRKETVGEPLVFGIEVSRMNSSNKMYVAIVRNEADTIRQVIADDPSLLTRFYLEDSWLHMAAEAGRIEIMEILINAGLDVDRLTSDSMRTPLDTAAGQGHFKPCEWLLDHGADINHGLGKQATPIFSAVFSKSLSLVELFVNRGANLNARFGDPSVDLISYAQQHGTPEIVTYLRSRVDQGYPSGEGTPG
jgi:ankyrin repeat protein